MLHKILESDRIEDKCNILLKILSLIHFTFLPNQTRHLSDKEIITIGIGLVCVILVCGEIVLSFQNTSVYCFRRQG